MRQQRELQSFKAQGQRETRSEESSLWIGIMRWKGLDRDRRLRGQLLRAGRVDRRLWTKFNRAEHQKEEAREPVEDEERLCE